MLLLRLRRWDSRYLDEGVVGSSGTGKAVKR
jgi:hypothetical protein